MNKRHELGELIASIQESNGWSDRDLERRADALGLRLSKSNFSRLKNNELVSIKGSLIKELSRLLGVSERTIANASLSSMGVHLAQGHVSIEEAVRSDTDLTDRDMRITLSLVDILKREEGDGHGTTTPPTDAGGTPATDGNTDTGNPTPDAGGAEVHDLGERRTKTGERKRLSPEKLARLEELQRRGDAATDEEIEGMAAYDPEDGGVPSGQED